VSRPSAGPDVVRRFAPPLLLAALFAVLAAMSWRRWPDLLVDFGQQLYVPWRLAAGERLQREIILLHGPLSQHFNAAWFALFGPSLTLIAIVNLAILALLTGAVYRLARPYGTPLSATLCGATLLAVFGFGQYVKTGNYNFVTPYTHESTHGLVLAALMLLALGGAIRGGGRRAWAIAGLCLGLAVLTKVDVALAALAAACAGLLAGMLFPRGRRRDLLWFGAGAVLPPGLFLIYFLTYLPPGAALRAVGGGFAALSGEVARNPFYRRVAGLDDPLGNLWLMLVMAGVGVGLVLFGAVADIVTRDRARQPAAVGVAGGAILFLALIVKPDLLPWQELPRALPVAALAVMGGISIRLRRSGHDAARCPPLVLALLVTVFALALPLKTALNLHAYHYGFYLALPATLVVLVACLEGIPRLLREGPGCGVVFRSLAIALCAAGAIHHVGLSRGIYAMKSYPVGRGGDAIITFSPLYDGTGPIVAGALDWLETNTAPGESFVGFPEGIMLNYLARRPARTGCMNFMMTEMILFGEDRLLEDLRRDPPDYVLLVHKDTTEFGVGPFGRDDRYGRGIIEWVEREYRSVALFGDEPLRDDRFGIRILKRAGPPG
jgi:hypothetical protein